MNRFVLALAVVAAVAGAAIAAVAQYLAIDLSEETRAGGFPLDHARFPRANGLNEWGDVAGLASPGTNEFAEAGASRPFLFFKSARTITNTGDLEGDDGFGNDQSTSAWGVNNLGWIAGGAGTYSYSLPFLWIDADLDGVCDPGEMNELDLNSTDYRGTASDVNDAGEVLVSGDSALTLARFEAPGGVLTEVGDRTQVEDQYAFSSALNENGDVCWSIGETGNRHGYRWIDRNEDDVADPGEIAVIDSPWGGDRASASDINDAGHVCGNARVAATVKRGFLWIDANTNDVAEVAEFLALTDLYPGAYIYPKGINNHDEIVGDVAQGSNRFAFIWDADRGLRDLNDFFSLEHPERGRYTARQGICINDAGQIAVNGAYENTGSEDYTVLLVPLPRLTSIRRDGIDAIRINAALLSPATTVTVERASTVTAADWSPVGGWVALESAADWTDPVGAPAGAYRLSTEDLPGAREP